MKNTQKGFTLIEMLVVIAIIVILTGIIITNLTSAKAKSRDARRISDLSQIQLALEQYFDRCGKYPGSTSNSVDENDSCPSGGQTVTILSFISKIPRDPSSDDSYGYAVSTEIGTANLDYLLHATLEIGGNSVVKGNPDQSKLPSWFTSINPAPFSCSTEADSTDYCLSPK